MSALRLPRFLFWVAAPLWMAACTSSTVGENRDESPDGCVEPDATAPMPYEGVPPRPDAEDDSGSVSPQLFALRDLVLEMTTEEADATGFDVDGFDTLREDDPVECSAPAGNIVLDGPGGIDNVFGRDVYENVDTAIQLSSHPEVLDTFCLPDPETCTDRRTFQEVVRDNQEQGTGTWLVRLEDYDGTTNDPELTATLLQAAFGTPCDPDGTLPAIESWDPDTGELLLAGGEPAPPPSWEPGADCWVARSGDYVAADPDNPPKIFDDRAYVADGTLVVQLPDGRSLDLFAESVGTRMILFDGLLTARLGAGRIQGATFASRWAITDLLEASKHLAMCDGSVEQSTLAGVLDRRADLRRLPPDHTSRDTDCNALSTGFRFEGGVTGHLHPDVASGRPLPNPCER